MKCLNVSHARANLYKLVDETAYSHEPIYIKGKEHNAVLINEEDWSAIQETLYLSSIPGMKESLIKGQKESLDKCATSLKW